MNVKRLSQYLICVVFAIILWLLHNFSKEYTSYFRYNLAITTRLEGRSALAFSDKPVLVKGKASGFYILTHNRIKVRSRQALQLTLEPSLLYPCTSDGDLFYLLPAQIQGSLADALSPSVELEAVYTDTLQFLFPRENYKKVKVAVRADVSYASQYESFEPFELRPDSIVVYGSETRLSQVDSVFTENIVLAGLKHTVQGVAKLDPLPDVRFSDKEVKYELSVERFVEMTLNIKVNPVNLPPRADMILVPDEVSLVCHCPFSKYKELSESDFELVVDYHDFDASLSGKMIPELVKKPEGLYLTSIDPPYIDCIIQKK